MKLCYYVINVCFVVKYAFKIFYTCFFVVKCLAVSELPENEFLFKCPVPKDVNYTLILKLSTTVLTYDSKTSIKEISEQWRDKVIFNPENETVKLSHLNKEQLGTYTCESTSADEDRYIMQASVSSRSMSTFLRKKASGSVYVKQ